MLKAIRRLFRKQRKPIPKLVTNPYKSQRAKKPVPPEEAEVRRRVAEEERLRNNEIFQHFRSSPKKPATQEATNLERAQRIIIAAARYTEDDRDKERLKEVYRRVSADVRREAKEKEVG